METRAQRLIRWLDLLIAESEKPAPVPIRQQEPRCRKCGTPKSYDLFKGEHCPRCNDWC